LACRFWRRFFKIFSVYFYSFTIISPWKRGLPFIRTILSSRHIRIIYANFGYNWPSGSGEKVENVKSRRQTDDQKSSLELQLRWAKNYLTFYHWNEITIVSHIITSSRQKLPVQHTHAEFCFALGILGSRGQFRTIGSVNIF
jgi:hypothetical protein